MRTCVALAGMRWYHTRGARVCLWGRVPRVKHAVRLLQLLAPHASAASVVVGLPLGISQGEPRACIRRPGCCGALERAGGPARCACAHGEHGARHFVEACTRLDGEIHVVEA